MNKPTTVSEAIEQLRNQMGWSDYVPDTQYTPEERHKLIKACVHTAKAFKRINEKYVD